MKSEVTVCTKCFNTLGIDSRMKIYRFLKEKGENTVTAVVEVVKLTQPTVSYHLKEMRDAIILFRLNEMELSTFIQIKEKVAKNLTELI